MNYENVLLRSGPSPNIEPKSACGGWEPRPRNDSPAVSRIIQPIVVEKATIMVGIKFGNSSKIIQENVPLPDIFAAIIKSEFAYANEIPLTFLAKKGILTIATATSELKSPGPITANSLMLVKHMEMPLIHLQNALKYYQKNHQNNLQLFL